MIVPSETQLAILSRRMKVAELTLKGVTQFEICRRLGMEPTQRSLISKDLKAIKTEWRAQAVETIDRHKARELAKLDVLEREYWEAWERSKTERTNSSTRRQERSRPKIDPVTGTEVMAKSTLDTVEMSKEKRDGNPAFLAGVMSCIDRRSKILGLDAPVEICGAEDKPPIQVEVSQPDYSKLDADELRQMRELRAKLFSGAAGAN